MLLLGPFATRTASLRCLRSRIKVPAPLQPSILPLKQLPASSRLYTADVAANGPPVDLVHTRNIGIIAHIDAGKTTTTERMLYYSGFTRRIGDVDEGSTVMDYLPAERSRGITITSAAITFNWTPSSSSQPHTINLIDTPGHADFTFEVERSIRVLDGAVTILDGVAGVEAQTEKVWKQADKYQIPRIIFINKLDRIGARFGATVREVAAKLNGWPAVTQIPLYENDGKGGEDVLRGIVDIVEKRVFVWELGGDGQNISVHDYDWLSSNHPSLHAEALGARVALVELLSEHDSDLVEKFFETGDHQLISAKHLKHSLRNLTMRGDGKIIPVLCGASFRNIGVQPLLDSVTELLPSPLDRPPVEVSYGSSSSVNLPSTERETLAVTPHLLCALAFKVVHDPKRGAMVFVRVYSGSLVRSQSIYNTNLAVKERAHRLLQMYADEAVDIASIPTGHIGVIIGLKHARTGDTLISTTPSASSAASPKKHPRPHKGQQQIAKHDPNALRLAPIPVPPPVFFTSLEPHSLSAQESLNAALAILLREDPSLQLSEDPDSGQILLSGMGELHLEISRDRLVKDLKAKADMGKIMISYREGVPGPCSEPVRRVFDRELAGKQARAGCCAEVDIVGVDDHGHADHDANLITTAIAHAPGEEKLRLPSHLDEASIRAAMHSGASAALARGPHLGLPVREARVKLLLRTDEDLFGVDSTTAAITSAARMAVTAALKKSLEEAGDNGGQILEPVMAVAVAVDETDMGKVVGDISSARGGQVVSLSDDEEYATSTGDVEMDRVYVPKIGDTGVIENTLHRKRVVNAMVPLGEMVGYLKHLRSMTGGRGTFVMHVEGWERVQGPRKLRAEREMRGVME